MTLDRIYITFAGGIAVENLYIEDLNKDTLLFSRSLTADIPLWPILTDRRLAIKHLNWQGVQANIYRKKGQDFNYQFLIDAFAPRDTMSPVMTDTTSSSMSISINAIQLTDICAAYTDDVGGLTAYLQLGQFQIKMNETDLENMKFEVASAVLKDSRFSYEQLRPFPESPDTSEFPLPFLALDDIRISNVSGLYHSIPDEIKSTVDIRDFQLKAPVVDLQHNEVQVELVALNNSEMEVITYPDTLQPTEPRTELPDVGNVASLWPAWEVTLDKIILQKNRIAYQVDGIIPESGHFNPQVLILDQFTLNGDNIFLKEHASGGNLTQLHFNEASGIKVDQFRLNWKIDDQNLRLSDIAIEALESELTGEIAAKYTSLQSMIEQPENVKVNINLDNIQVAIDKLYQFQPNLATNPYIKMLAQKPVVGRISASGPVNSLNVTQAGIEWGSGTSVFASGQLDNVTNPDVLRFSFPNIRVRSSRNDLNLFFPEDSLGIRYPDIARLTAGLSGNLEEISTSALLESDLGRVNVVGSIQYRDTISFDTDISVTGLLVDSLLQNPEMGPLSLTLSATGKGTDLYTMDGRFQTTIDRFTWNQYPIRNLILEGHIDGGQGKISSSYRDNNLDLTLEGNIELDSISPEVNASLNVKTADLMALSLADRNVRTDFRMAVRFKGNDTAFHTTAKIFNGTIFLKDNSYPVGNINLSAYVTPDTTSGTFSSRMMDIHLESNTSPGGFIQAFTRHVKSYLTDTVRRPDRITAPVRIFMEASVRKDPLLTDVFFSGLEEMDSIRMEIDFQESKKKLTAIIDAPHVVYSGVEIDSVILSANSDPDQFNMDLGIRRLSAGPVSIHKTTLTNKIQDNKFYSHFIATYDGENLIEFKTETSPYEDSLRIHLVPSGLVINSLDWDVPANNQILIGENKMEFNSMKVSRGNQFISIEENQGDNDLIVNIQRFNISNIISYFNPDSLLASGQLSGQLTLEQPLGTAGLIADIQVDSLRVLQVDLGRLDLYGETEDARNYSADLHLRGGEIDVTTSGEYHATDEDARVLVDLNIDSITMNAIESFSMGTIENSSGYLAGTIHANGLLSDLRYDGRLHFHNAHLTPSQLQTPFSLGQQQITFDNEGVTLNNFTISDREGNTFVVDGDIGTSDIFNPTFNLSMEAQNFQLLNATSEDNELYYGTAIFDANARLTGDLNLPELNLQLYVGEGTDVTYVMPHGQAQIQSREGIVTFVNKAEPVKLMSEKEKDPVVIRGVKINALVKVNEEASFNVIISEETGDHFKILGSGDLVLSIDELGRMSLTGIYTLHDGHYEMNLYNLVNRRFQIAEGSTVSWSGDPFDPNLDVRAIYKIETSPASLMASQTSGADQSVQNQYRRKLPFLVYLNVDGRLSEPQLAFDIDMPEDSRGEVGGQVYGRIQQINQEEQQVNKQVFALLVLNRFYPTSGSDGSSGGIVSVARDNLNQALSDQLNIFSDRLLGDTGFELNFGLDSYTDYGGQNPQNRTELGIAAQKSFLNERLIVNVGSEFDIEGGNSNPQEHNPIIGNVSVEYLITSNGQLRIRGFRKNVYENVIDGQTIVSGLALIFTKEFNKFHELWLPMISEDEQKAEVDQSE